jgi:6-phosphogluconolactonase
MTSKIKILENADQVAEKTALEIKELADKAKAAGKKFNLAISGGSTPMPFFRLLAGEKFKNSIPWDFLHVYWVDERCVLPADPESNYGVAYSLWLKNVPIPPANIHRIIGEADPDIEARRYGQEIRANLPVNAIDFPCFDLVILGIGNDGHTASLFPGAVENLRADTITLTAEHPETGQKRVTLSLRTINNSLKILLIVTEKEKSRVIADILSGSEKKKQYPAGLVRPVNGELEWFLNKEAASGINN